MRDRPNTAAGQAAYNPGTLALYDTVVLRLSNPWIWRCPSRVLLADYDRHVTDNHLDVGVGSGYFLAHCDFASADPRLVLLDLNPHSLAHAARRLARYRPETHRVDVLEPITLDMPAFDSIGLTYLLHCLPGPMPYKLQALDHLMRLLTPTGTLFGATIVHAGAAKTRPAEQLMALYNRLGVFDNEHDSPCALRRGLERRFGDVEIETTGCVARFAARR